MNAFTIKFNKLKYTFAANLQLHTPYRYGLITHNRIKNTSNRLLQTNW